MRARRERLFNDVDIITRIRPYRNYTNLSSLEKSANYIKEEFVKCKLITNEQKWIVSEIQYKNIVASYNWDKKNRLIIGAHYDVAGNTPGADDNASAIAGLLEIARLVAEIKPNIDYRIDFVAYCLEEPPFFGTHDMGSFIHAKSLWAENASVIGMICFEMIGYYSKFAIQDQFKTESALLGDDLPTIGNYIAIVGNDDFCDFNEKFYISMSEGSAIDVHLISLPSYNELVGMSDHRNYWKFGYNALMINDTAFIRNPNYHRISDTIQTLDFDKMTEVLNSTYRAVVNF